MFEYAQKCLRVYSKYINDPDLEDNLSELLCMQLEDFVISVSESQLSVGTSYTSRAESETTDEHGSFTPDACHTENLHVPANEGEEEEEIGMEGAEEEGEVEEALESNGNSKKEVHPRKLNTEQEKYLISFQQPQSLSLQPASSSPTSTESCTAEEAHASQVDEAALTPAPLNTVDNTPQVSLASPTDPLQPQVALAHHIESTEPSGEAGDRMEGEEAEEEEGEGEGKTAQPQGAPLMYPQMMGPHPLMFPRFPHPFYPMPYYYPPYGFPPSPWGYMPPVMPMTFSPAMMTPMTGGFVPSMPVPQLQEEKAEREVISTDISGEEQSKTLEVPATDLSGSSSTLHASQPSDASDERRIDSERGPEVLSSSLLSSKGSSSVLQLDKSKPPASPSPLPPPSPPPSPPPPLSSATNQEPEQLQPSQLNGSSLSVPAEDTPQPLSKSSNRYNSRKPRASPTSNNTPSKKGVVQDSKLVEGATDKTGGKEKGKRETDKKEKSKRDKASIVVHPQLSKGAAAIPAQSSEPLEEEAKEKNEEVDTHTSQQSTGKHSNHKKKTAQHGSTNRQGGQYRYYHYRGQYGSRRGGYQPNYRGGKGGNRGSHDSWSGSGGHQDEHPQKDHTDRDGRTQDRKGEGSSSHGDRPQAGGYERMSHEGDHSVHEAKPRGGGGGGRKGGTGQSRKGQVRQVHPSQAAQQPSSSNPHQLSKDATVRGVLGPSSPTAVTSSFLPFPAPYPWPDLTSSTPGVSPNDSPIMETGSITAWTDGPSKSTSHGCSDLNMPSGLEPVLFGSLKSAMTIVKSHTRHLV